MSEATEELNNNSFRLKADIELRHVIAFVTVTEEASFTRAAALLCITQPALSRTIAQLERRLGTRLLDRSTHSVDVTADGEKFFQHARNIIWSVQDAIASVHGSGVLRIGFTWSAAVDLTSMIIRSFEQSHPGITVELKRWDDRYAGLTDGRSHLAFLRGRPLESSIRSVTLFEERRYAAFHPDHPLARRDDVKLEEIATDPLIVNTISGITSPELWGCRHPDRVLIETRNLDEWLEAVGLGRGIGVTPESTKRLYSHPWISYVRILDAPLIPVVLAWPVERAHPLCSDVVTIAKEIAKRHPRRWT